MGLAPSPSFMRFILVQVKDGFPSATFLIISSRKKSSQLTRKKLSSIFYIGRTRLIGVGSALLGISWNILLYLFPLEPNYTGEQWILLLIAFSPGKRRKPETKIKTPRTTRRHFFKIFTSQLVNNCENYTILEKYLLRDFNYSIL